jgi:hypothetical protein
MLATLLQLAALAGFPIGGALGITTTTGGLVVGLSVSFLIFGDALEQHGPT